MYYTVSEISGDYAVLRCEESGLERSVALALLPEDIDTGDRLLFEDFSEEEIELFLSMLDRICESVRRRVERDNEQREEKGV